MRTRLGVLGRAGAAGSPLGLSAPCRQSAQSLAVGGLIRNICKIAYMQVAALS